MGQVEVQEDALDGGRLGEEGDDPHLAAATTLRAVPGAEQRKHLSVLALGEDAVEDEHVAVEARR